MNHAFNNRRLMNEKVGENVRLYKRKEIWCVNYQIEGKQIRKSLGTKNKKQALLQAQKLDQELLLGNSNLPRKDVTFNEIAEEYINAVVIRGRSKATVKKYKQFIDSFLAFLGQSNLQHAMKITPLIMDRYRKQRIDEICGKFTDRDGMHTTQDEIQRIHGVLKFAVDRKIISSDPLQGYKVPIVKPKTQPYWTQGEIHKILANSRLQPHRDVFEFLAFTGARIEEVRQLTWANIDWESNVIKIQAKKGWKPKSGDARCIPIIEPLKLLLQRQPQQQGWVFKFPKTERHATRQINPRRLLAYLKDVLAELGLPGHLHTFRHSFISLALTKGIPADTVRTWIGHVDQEILRHYTHIASQESQLAMRNLWSQLLNFDQVQDLK